ncbi:MAG: hypothetical protein CVU38_19375 [Chloroflexi bacterium HGW-Chloroflexi-1]|nr:MAG: hypothetical protein CVU38_19375 [Chloroflexi bacterium HGW-Chloroflexi-1]
MPRVAILMADSGGGHRSAAVSLAEALEGRARGVFVNLLDEHAPFPLNHLSALYGPLVNRAPWLYHAIYQASASRRRLALLEDAAYPWVQGRITAALVAEQPDLVINVHPMQNALPLRSLRGAGNRAPFVTVVTDPVSPSMAWFYPAVDLCVVATDAARRVALTAGMDPSRVVVIGLPVRRAFAAARGRLKPAGRASLGLPPERPLVLLTGGGAGIGRLPVLARAIARRLAQAHIPTQMAIIAGHNQPLQQHLQAEPWPLPVTVLGFVDAMADWLAAADLLITKAGPGTLAEAACVGVPVLVTGFIPGQEAGNVTWVESSGMGIFADQPDRAAALVAEWFAPGDPTLARMAAHAAAAAQPDAAERIVCAALALLPDRSDTVTCTAHPAPTCQDQVLTS